MQQIPYGSEDGEVSGTVYVDPHVTPPWMEKGWYDPQNDMIVWESDRQASDLEGGEDDYPVVYRIPADWA